MTDSQSDLKWQLYEEQLVHFLQDSPDWKLLRLIAEIAFGDPNLEPVLAAIAEKSPRFVVHQGVRVKLSSEERERMAKTGHPVVLPCEPGSEHIQAAAAVRVYAEQLLPFSCAIERIGPGKPVGTRFLHEVTLADEDDDRRFVDDTPVTLKSTSSSAINGYIAGTSRTDPVVYVAFDYEILPSDLPATLEIHRRKLWHDIADKLLLTSSPPKSTAILFNHLNEKDIRFEHGKSLAFELSNLPQPWSRLLWGPPGSGKTYCLGWLVVYLVKLRNPGRILIVAPSNVAVDAATNEVVAAFEIQLKDALKDRRIVRYGYPRDEKILGRPELLGPDSLEALSKAIHQKHQEVKKLRQDRAKEEVIAETKAELKQLEEERKREVRDHLQQSKVVLTTIAAVCQSGSPIQDSGIWDTVIADECSMLNGALALFLGTLAEKRYLLAGDPRQLSPIFEWRRGEASDDIKRWLARDPFELIGFTAGTGAERTVKDHDARVARLVSQRRCHPDIWKAVSGLYPGVKPEVSLQKLEPITQFHPKPGQPVVVFDTGASDRELLNDSDNRDAAELADLFESSCRKTGKSWENPSTARIAIELARDIKASHPEASVSIIAPYRAQVRLVRRWIDEEVRSDARGNRKDPTSGVFVGTVHSFQGGQSDVVIFDFVDGYPRSGPGALLKGDSAMRLLNVAMTRARGKLILIINKKWIAQKCTREQIGLLWDLLFGSPTNAAVVEVLPPLPSPATVGPATESPIEEKVLREMKVRQEELPPFALQVPICNERGKIVSRADFAFVDKKVAIYCDGARFHLVQQRWRRDLKQRRELMRLGWQPLVFSGSEINHDVRGVVRQIVEHFKNGPSGGSTPESVRPNPG